VERRAELGRLRRRLPAVMRSRTSEACGAAVSAAILLAQDRALPHPPRKLEFNGPQAGNAHRSPLSDPEGGTSPETAPGLKRTNENIAFAGDSPSQLFSRGHELTDARVKRPDQQSVPGRLTQR
jgi:hypothetical protein